MARHVLRPVLFGSMLVLMSAACQRAERSDADDTMTPPQDPTSSQNAPAPLREPTSDLESQKEESLERIHVTGKDDEQLGGGGKGGSASTGATAGSSGSHSM